MVNAKNTIKNIIHSELKRYVTYKTVKSHFFKIQNRFFARLRNRGYKKVQLKRIFRRVKFRDRVNLLTISLETFDFREIRDTEVESGLISESEHIFMDVFAEVFNSQSVNNPRSTNHIVSINVPLLMCCLLRFFFPRKMEELTWSYR